jgi:hypothetical protein
MEESKINQEDFANWKTKWCVQTVEALLERVSAVEGDEFDHRPKFSSFGQKVNVRVPGIRVPVHR